MTIWEMIAGAALMAILALMVVPSISERQARESAATAFIDASAVVERYASENCGSLPADIAVADVYTAMSSPVTYDFTGWRAHFSGGDKWIRVTDPSTPELGILQARFKGLPVSNYIDTQTYQVRSRVQPHLQVTKQLILDGAAC